ncbi:uncharacterized protein LOC131675390 [Phymastichus coffea]|uniref:uncharacterized protein LOC131675390 n=1 Tax=Phymastichus coffea TaxID=108790 RepID=UPI00273BBD06|nr:uncharacterized protein LOC131675390 [Phymastichus coffea]
MTSTATQKETNNASQQAISNFLLGMDRIAFRAPPYVPNEPELWFSQLEHSFASAGITGESSKFSYMSGCLDPRYSTIIKDLIIAPPSETPYTTAKSELLRRLNVSQDAKTRRLLEDQVLGDRMPSVFLRHLRDLVGASVPETLLRTLWLGRLPSNVQAILATQKDTALEKTAELADCIVETMHSSPLQFGQPQMAAVATATNAMLEALTAQIAQLTQVFRQEIAEVRREAREDRERPLRQRTRNRSPSRGRSKSRGSHSYDQCWYHWKFGAQATKCKKPYTQIRYLIDTEADLCVYPRTSIRGPVKKTTYELSAANNTAIATYGTMTLSLNLGLRRTHLWRFIIADVPKAIIGADFLSHYGLLVDLQGGQLIDRETKRTSRGEVHICEGPSIKIITGSTNYHRLLAKYPDITRPDGRTPVTRHKTRHYIETTPGPPSAREKFEVMLQLGTARISNSSWASPLHMAPKGETDERPCGDYRSLNARTIPDRYPVPHIRDFAQRLRG